MRYRVEGSGASLGYGAEQTSDVTTDNQGRASVAITPTDAQAGTTNIAVEIIRPEQAGVASSPRVTLGAGLTSLTWNGAAVIPPVDTTLPPTVTPPPATIPPTTPPPTSGTPDLDVAITQVTPNPLRVGDTVAFNITITNRGSAVARNVVFVDNFSTGLFHPGAAEGSYTIRSSAVDPDTGQPTSNPIEIAPGESYSTSVEFQIVAAGPQSHTVNVEADGAVPASRTAYINVEGGAAGGVGGIAPTLNVQVLGPPQHNVGEMAEYRIVVENTGSVTATNVEVLNTRDGELRPRVADESYDANLFRTSGQLFWRLAELAPGTRTVFSIQCECVAPAEQACCRVEVRANGLPSPLRAEACTTIRAPLSGNVPPPGNTSPATPPLDDQGLKVEITSPAVPRVQEQFILFVRVRNDSPQTRRNFQMRLLIPPQLQADVNNISSSNLTMQPPNQRQDGLELVFGPLGEILPGEAESISLRVIPVQPGNATIYARRIAEGIEPFDSALTIEVMPR